MIHVRNWPGRLFRWNMRLYLAAAFTGPVLSLIVDAQEALRLARPQRSFHTQFHGGARWRMSLAAGFSRLGGAGCLASFQHY